MDNQIGSLIKAEIRKQGRTSKWVAEKLGCTESTMSLKLSGKLSLTYEEIREIKKLLSLPSDWTGTNEEQDFMILELFMNGNEDLDVIAEQTNATFEQVSTVIINGLKEQLKQ